MPLLGFTTVFESKVFAIASSESKGYLTQTRLSSKVVLDCWNMLHNFAGTANQGVKEQMN